MNNAGIGTPYWYEWEIGIIECLKMMTNTSIEAVTIQSNEFQSLDDVVVKYTDGSIANIQVKHTDANYTLTYSDLESDKMLKSWASEWNKVKANYTIRSLSIVTNRKWGPNATNGKCSFSYFINDVLPKLKNDLSYLGKNNQEKNAIEWFKKTINLTEDDTNEFIKIIDFKNQEDLAGLEEQIKDSLSKILGTDKPEVTKTAIDRLRSNLEKWATSRREKPEITKEDIYNVLCEPQDRLPQYELYPQKPIFPSRIEYANHFTNNLIASDKKIIFLQGLPGAGKTNFISYLAQATDTIVDFRYYTYLPVNKDTPSFSDDEGFYSGKELWTCILYQIKRKFEKLHLLSKLKFPLLYDYMTITELRSTVLKYLPIYSKKCGRTCYLFIDGMDHAARSNKAKDTFLLQLPRPEEVGDGVKFIFVGQPINDKYPKWMINNPDIEYYELPLLEVQDIKTIIETNNIEITNVDIDTLSSSIIKVVGNNTLNVLFAVLEIQRLSTDLDFDSIINHLKTRSLNSYIDRYYDWILSSISPESELLLLRIEAIYAFTSRKISIEKLVKLCETDKMNIEAILHKLYPIIVSDEYGYYTFHNDVRLYFKKVIRANSNFTNIIDSINSSILNNEVLDEFRYDILFNLSVESHNIAKVFEFYNSDYIIGSINYQMSINRLLDQYSTVFELFMSNPDLKLIHNLSIVSTSISKLIDCVNYYEKDKQFIESRMTPELTRSEKYVLIASEKISQIIDDIYTLLKSEEHERATKLFNEYLKKEVITELLSDDNTNQKEYKKIGYVYRFLNPDIFSNLSLENCYDEFVSGWLEASSEFFSIADIQKTFTFHTCSVSALHNYVSEIIKSSEINNETIAYLADTLCGINNISLHTMTEICNCMILKKMPCTALQDQIYKDVCEIHFFEPLAGDIAEFKAHGVLLFFKTYFCLYKYSNTIEWDTLYDETLKNKRISTSNRGYEPAIELKSLADRINSLFYYSEGTYNDILNTAYDLTYFKRNREGSCYDCGTSEVLPYFKRIFLQYFINTPEYAEKPRLCTDLLQIFTGQVPYYIDELAQLYFLFDNKELFLQIAEFWCGTHGIVWTKRYDDIEYICDKIVGLLNKFNEFELAKRIQRIKQIKILGYVGHKDYTLNGLFECYKQLPTCENKLIRYGMDLLSISDYANEIGDNCVYVYDELFNVASDLGAKYLDALFEQKNKPKDLIHWRTSLLSALYNKVEKLFTSDDELISLYKLTNAWINAEIEKKTQGFNELETLYRYNKRIVNLISNSDLKEIITSRGNCTPTKISNGSYPLSHNQHSDYSHLINLLEADGYSHDFEKAFLRLLVVNDGHLYDIINELVERISENHKNTFISKCVIPYFHLDSDYGFRFRGKQYIIKHCYSYFGTNDWIELLKDISQRIIRVNNDFDYYHLINEDFELLVLYYYLQNYPDRIEQLFKDKCKMHFSFITSSEAITVEKLQLNIDDKIKTFSDFVQKQICKASL